MLVALSKRREVRLPMADEEVGDATVRFIAGPPNTSEDRGAITQKMNTQEIVKARLSSLTPDQSVDGLTVIQELIERVEREHPQDTPGIVVQTMPIAVALALLTQVDKMGDEERAKHIKFARSSALAVLKQALRKAQVAPKSIELETEIKRALEWAGILWFFENIKYSQLPGS